MVLEWKKSAKLVTVNFTEEIASGIMRKYARAMNVELQAQCGVQMEFNISKVTNGTGQLHAMMLHGTTEKRLN